MGNSYEQQAIDLVAENEALTIKGNHFELKSKYLTDEVEALTEALDNMIDGANVWSEYGNCCYCNGRKHKKDCEYKAAIALLDKIKLSANN